MSKLSIVSFVDAKEVALGRPHQIMEVDYTTASVQSSALTNPTNTKKNMRVRLYSNADCFVIWGLNPTAGDYTDSIPLGADNPEYFAIDSGDKIAVIERA